MRTMRRKSFIPLPSSTPDASCPGCARPARHTARAAARRAGDARSSPWPPPLHSPHTRTLRIQRTRHTGRATCGCRSKREGDPATLGQSPGAAAAARCGHPVRQDRHHLPLRAPLRRHRHLVSKVIPWKRPHVVKQTAALGGKEGPAASCSRRAFPRTPPHSLPPGILADGHDRLPGNGGDPEAGHCPSVAWTVRYRRVGPPSPRRGKSGEGGEHQRGKGEPGRRGSAGSSLRWAYGLPDGLGADGLPGHRAGVYAAVPSCLRSSPRSRTRKLKSRRTICEARNEVRVAVAHGDVRSGDDVQAPAGEAAVEDSTHAVQGALWARNTIGCCSMCGHSAATVRTCLAHTGGWGPAVRFKNTRS